MNHHATKSETLKIQNILESKVYIAHNDDAITFMSQEEATKEFLKNNDDVLSEEEMIETAGFNPITAKFDITVSKDFNNIQELEKIKKELESYLSVKEVDLSLRKKNKIQALGKNLKVLKLILFGVILFSITVIIVLINNTIKLAMFSQRFLIRSMQLVGAKSSFIRRPFIAKSFSHGLIGGIVSSALIYGLLRYSVKQIDFLQELLDYNLLSVVFIGLALFGAILCSMSTYFAVNRYLKLSLDDLY